MTKYVKSIKFSTSGETYMIRDAEQKSRIDTLETQVDEKANTSYVNNALAGKQETLKSGINIKTINNESLLGSGNITIGGGSGGTTNYEDLSNLPKINNVELKGNKTATDLGLATKSSVESKQDILVSGTNIKTINGESLLGSSDIEVVSSY